MLLNLLFLVNYAKNGAWMIPCYTACAVAVPAVDFLLQYLVLSLNSWLELEATVSPDATTCPGAAVVSTC